MDRDEDGRPGRARPASSGSWSGAFGINDSGQVVGSWAPSQSTRGTDSHPWLYSNDTITSLPEPSGLTAPSCEAIAINNNGQIAGYGTTSTGATDGFLDSNGTVTDLGSFTPFALNDNGVMVDGGDLIDSGGTVQNLNNLIPAKSGYTITGASAINDDGQIAAIAGANVTLRNLTLQGKVVSPGHGDGGGIDDLGTLTLDHVTVTSNRTVAGWEAVDLSEAHAVPPNTAI